MAMDIMRTHPLVIIGGLLRENPFFIPPEQFLDETRERWSAYKTAASPERPGTSLFREGNGGGGDF